MSSEHFDVGTMIRHPGLQKTGAVQPGCQGDPDCLGADAVHGPLVSINADPGSLGPVRFQPFGGQGRVPCTGSPAQPASASKPEALPDMQLRSDRVAMPAERPGAGVVGPLRMDAAQFGQARRWLSQDASSLRNAAGSQRAARDGLRAQHTVDEDEALHHRAIERLALHAWTVLPDGQVDFISERLAALTGAAAFTDGHIDVVHVADRARTVAAWIHAVATGTPFAVEHRVLMLDGGVRWMRSRANPQRDGAGRVIKWYGFSEDIHDAKQAAMLLAEREARLLAITNSVDQLIWTSGPDGCHDYYNKAWHDFTGIPLASATDEFWSQSTDGLRQSGHRGGSMGSTMPVVLANDGLRHPDDHDRCGAAWLRCLQTGEPYHVEYRLRHRTGQYRWVLARAHAARDAAGRIERWYGTVTDIHEIVEARDALARSRGNLESAKQQAEDANAAKSRFLAAASHNLRQPLQTMTLLESLLAKKVDGDAGRLVSQLNETLGAMAGMLDALLDINGTEAGAMGAEVAGFSVGDLLNRLRHEFAYHAQAKGLALQVVPCSAVVQSDPRLLEQMIRNLVSNALKHTAHGRVLLGCRRRGDALSIEVWDTGIGIADAKIRTIFKERCQDGDEGRERGRGLSVVQRLGGLLGHQVRARSQPGKGSVFSIEVACLPLAGPLAGPVQASGGAAPGAGRRVGSILVIEDDPDLRDALEMLLLDEGHSVMAASSGPAALGMVRRSLVAPDLVLADYNLLGSLDGLQATAKVRDMLARAVPTIILTGDTSTGTLRDIGLQDCVHLGKPVKPDDLLQAVQDLLPLPPVPMPPTLGPGRPAVQPKPARCPDAPVVHVVDDDGVLRDAIRRTLEHGGQAVEDYPSGEAFLAAYRSCRPGREECLLIDVAMPGMDGLEVLRRLDAGGHWLPAIMITGRSDVPTAVHAMKAGVLDFIRKPLSGPELLEGVARALDRSRDAAKRSACQSTAAGSVARLTQRQRDVMAMVLAGQPSKNIAADLGISQRTVETHRSTIMRKMGVRSLPALARLALAADPAGAAGNSRLPALSAAARM